MVVCLGSKSKGSLVGTVLARDKGGIVAAWAPLSLPLSLCFELSAAVRTGKNTSWRLVTQEEGVGLSFLSWEIHEDHSWNRQLSHVNASDTRVRWFVQGKFWFVKVLFQNEHFELIENDFLWCFTAPRDPSVCMYVTCITAPLNACSERVKQSRRKKRYIL